MSMVSQPNNRNGRICRIDKIFRMHNGMIKVIAEIRRCVYDTHRFDAKGRKYIGTPLKYYFEDVGLRNARIGFMHWGGGVGVG